MRMYFSVLLFSLILPANSFISKPSIPAHTRKNSLLASSSEDMSTASSSKPSAPSPADQAERISSIQSCLILESELSSRGQKPTSASQSDVISKAIGELEAVGTVDLANLAGQWRLVYCSDDVTRSSPFFWAFKKAFKSITYPMTTSSVPLADSIFLITDSLPLRSIGEATQSISDKALISSVLVKAEAGGISLGESVMKTSSRLMKVDGRTMEIQVDDTQLVQSSIEKYLPNLKKLMKFPSGSALELISPGSSTVYANITFLDSVMRIVRNSDDGNVFVFVKD